MKASAARLSWGILMLILGVLLVISGARQFEGVRLSYRETDLFLAETSDTFRAWLASIFTEAEIGHVELSIPERIARRLSIAPLPVRRQLTAAMMRSDFWEELPAGGTSAREDKSTALQAIYLALAREPAAGDLYLAAASLEVSLNGYSRKARRLLAASYKFAPRELDLAVRRLVVASLVWSLLTEEERSRVQWDLNFIRETSPALARRIAGELSQAGVKVDEHATSAP